MLQTLKKSLPAKIAIVIAALFLLMPAAASAQFGEDPGADTDNSDIRDGLDRGTCLGVSADSEECVSGDEANTGLNNIIATVINVFSIVVGVVSVIMIIIGGFKYVISGGESTNVTSAKNTILFAIVGLVIVAFAQVIVRFVLNRATTE